MDFLKEGLLNIEPGLFLWTIIMIIPLIISVIFIILFIRLIIALIRYLERKK